MSERKYRQRGYQDTGKSEKRERGPESRPPRQEQMGPRTPRMVGTITRARCANCGTVLTAGFDPTGKCPKCNAELHCCKQCRYFDSAARWECTQTIPEPIARKSDRNECTFYETRLTIEKDTSPAAPPSQPAPSSDAPSSGRPDDARRAFEDLFKK